MKAIIPNFKLDYFNGRFGQLQAVDLNSVDPAVRAGFFLLLLFSLLYFVIFQNVINSLLLYMSWKQIPDHVCIKSYITVKMENIYLDLAMLFFKNKDILSNFYIKFEYNSGLFQQLFLFVWGF